MTRTRKTAGRVVFVGAGPGDPGLLTRRAHDALTSADHIVYDRHVSDTMQRALLAFARSGDPNHPDAPRWEPYTLPRRQTMVFNVATTLLDDPRSAERRLFEKVPFTQQGT